MNIQTQKLELVKMILETDNPSILESVKKLFRKTKDSDFWNTLSQDEKDDILEGLRDVENGDLVDYDAFISKHR
jgi:hypothetical protein